MRCELRKEAPPLHGTWDPDELELVSVKDIVRSEVP
jgi:hypothetical protein